MIISFIYSVTLSKFVNSSFPQCNVHTGVQGGWLFQTVRIVEELASSPMEGILLTECGTFF